MQKKQQITQDNFYSEKYANSAWLNQREKDAHELLTRISSQDLFQSTTKVLDVGCGSGDLGKVLLQKYQCEVHGIDLNQVGIDRANQLGMHAQLADLDERWPYPDHTFDVVTAAEIIEHVLNTDNFLQEAFRVLKPGGSLVIMTPNLTCWFNRIIFLAGYQPFFTEVSTIDKTIGLSFTRNLTDVRAPVGHIRVFAYRALIELLQYHKFQISFRKGATVYYLPWYMDFFDYFFSKIPSLCTDITVVAKKPLNQ
ncbi:MAG: hypothetical protein KatS3mg087_0976 [Patescibacteria group bacterium]|nr:MAG: hypothetical protein KatS3mg087_0976 [Patescibacteria group bacterium]